MEASATRVGDQRVTQRFSPPFIKTPLFRHEGPRRHATKETFTALDDPNLTISTGTTVGLIGQQRFRQAR